MRNDGQISSVEAVYLDQISESSRENADKEDNLMDNCGILPNNCLPCLASTVSPVERRRSLSSSPPSARKKTALKIPIKWKEEHTALSLSELISPFLFLRYGISEIVRFQRFLVSTVLQFLRRRFFNDLWLAHRFPSALLGREYLILGRKSNPGVSRLGE